MVLNDSDEVQEPDKLKEEIDIMRLLEPSHCLPLPQILPEGSEGHELIFMKLSHDKVIFTIGFSVW